MSKIDILQAFRGLAAVGVVLYHGVAGTEHFIAPTNQIIKNLFTIGQLGVDAFFVLSGFIIFHTNFDYKLPRIVAAKSYLVKRLIRIYGPYLPISLIYVLALTIFPALSASGRDWGWVSSILLLPTASPPALGPAWTLVHEMIFYVIFLIFFLVGRPVFALFIAIWALLIAFNSYIIPSAIAVKAPESGDGDALTQVLAEINLEFIAGMLCAFAYRRRWLFEYSIYIVALGLCGLLAMWALFPHDRQSIEQYRLSYGLLFAFVIFGLVVTWERKRLRTGALLVWLGYISYSLYLVHYPIISIISRVSGKIVPPHIASVNIAICLIVSLIAATIYNRYYEEPSLRVLRGLFARKSVGDYSRDQKS